MRITFNNNINNVVKFVRICEHFAEDIDVYASRYIVDGKSILGVSGVCMYPDITVKIITDKITKREEFYNAIADFAVGVG